ncbi:AraC family transcriptional regulator [Owenweeksia hongkongensis]
MNFTLASLAYASGFNSKSIFSVSFNKNEGMTPQSWVKSNPRLGLFIRN